MPRFLRNTILLSTVLLLLPAGRSHSQTDSVFHLDRSMFRPDYDIPRGIEHGTWDFDEWPGVDHPVVYKQDFMNNRFRAQRLKIDYFRSVFDNDDHEGYLKSPAELRARGFHDLGKLLDDPGSHRKTIVGVFAHPDDEILLAGGLFAYAAKRGWDVHVYLVSNGADGSQGFSDERSDDLGGFNAVGVMPDGNVIVKTDFMAETKLALIKKYARILGISVTVMDFSLLFDGKRVRQIGEYPGLDYVKTFGTGTKIRKAISDEIESILRKEHPSLVFTHGKNGEYGNYLHQTVHDLVFAAAHMIGRKDMRFFTCFPEYNYDDHITHFIDLESGGRKAWQQKWSAFKSLSFLYRDGTDYDKPWNPNDDLPDGAFVKDYGYTPREGKPPRYEFFQQIYPISR